MTFGIVDQPVASHRPLLVSTDLDGVAGAAGPSVGSRQRPAKHRLAAGDAGSIHGDNHVGESGHEALSGGGNGSTAYGRAGGVDLQRSSGAEEFRHTGCVLASPGRSVACCELSQLIGGHQGSRATLEPLFQCCGKAAVWRPTFEITSRAKASSCASSSPDIRYRLNCVTPAAARACNFSIC